MLVKINWNNYNGRRGGNMNDSYGLDLVQSYLTLHKHMYTIQKPRNRNKEELVLLNKELATELNIDIDFLASPKGLEFLSGSTTEYGPLFSQAYAGHQYGHFTLLGDGRALMLGEQMTNEGLIDLQLKGSGKTPYSRGGDGNATLYSMLREYLISEAMNSQGIPSTRSLALLKTNETIQRQKKMDGAILVRTAKSHIRVGTFEYARTYGGIKQVRELANYTINRHFSHLKDSNNKYQEFLGEVIIKQAKLLAKWQTVGFVHGVMNTDNMSISGETIDYGPCVFLDTYTPSRSFSSIDREGRYSYQNQPQVASWNLARFAETLLDLLSDDTEIAVKIANKELLKFRTHFITEYYSLMAKKIGIIDPIEEEKALIDNLLNIMEKHKADYTNTFRLLTLDEYHKLPFFNSEEWKSWFQAWTRQLGNRSMDVNERIQLMEQSNPFIIPRNMVVEEALLKATEQNDYTLFYELLLHLKTPFSYHTNISNSFIEPKLSTEEYVTYCGT